MATRVSRSSARARASSRRGRNRGGVAEQFPADQSVYDLANSMVRSSPGQVKKLPKNPTPKQADSIVGLLCMLQTSTPEDGQFAVK